MHEILHLIGLCPDSLSHFDLMDLVVSNHQSFLENLNLKLKSYVIKR
jgi:hypothetical protein